MNKPYKPRPLLRSSLETQAAEAILSEIHEKADIFKRYVVRSVKVDDISLGVYLSGARRLLDELERIANDCVNPPPIIGPALGDSNGGER